MKTKTKTMVESWTMSTDEYRRRVKEAANAGMPAVNADPQPHAWGLFAYSDAPPTVGGAAGLFHWFKTKAQLLDFVKRHLTFASPGHSDIDPGRVAFETEQLMLPTLSLRIAGAPGPSNVWGGVWQAEVPNAPQPVTFELSIDGASVTGTLRPQDLPIFDGSVEGSRLRFRVRSPDGLRTITFSGVLEGDEISFTRDIEVPDGAPPGGRWIFGVDGAKTFVARREG